jgi:hypothetical protein
MLLSNLESDAAQLRRKRELCEEMLRALNILQPGFTARRGTNIFITIQCKNYSKGKHRGLEIALRSCAQ